MAEQVSQARIDAVKAAIPPDVYEAIIDEERVKLTRKLFKKPAPSYRDRVSGKIKRRLPPKSSPEDVRFVPGAVRHWRIIHGLTPPQASARIGYSTRSSAWRNWEAGFTAPPYETLLRMLAATGIGHWVDESAANDDASTRLQQMYADEQEKKRLRREKRAQIQSSSS